MTIAIDIDLCEAALRDAVAQLALAADLHPHAVHDFVETNAACLVLIYRAKQPQLRFDVWARREVARLWSEVMVKSA